MGLRGLSRRASCAARTRALPDRRGLLGSTARRPSRLTHAPVRVDGRPLRAATQLATLASAVELGSFPRHAERSGSTETGGGKVGPHPSRTARRPKEPLVGSRSEEPRRLGQAGSCGGSMRSLWDRGRRVNEDLALDERWVEPAALTLVATAASPIAGSPETNARYGTRARACLVAYGTSSPRACPPS